jgi:hypothetical protein
VEVTVSLAFDPDREESAGLLWDRPLAELRSVRLEVGEDDTVRQVCERGAQQLIPELAERLAGERYHEYGLGMGASEGSDLPPVYVDEVMLLDGDGQIIWSVGDFRSLTFRQLMRAHGAGLLPGDPTRLVLMSPQRGGGGVVIDWDSLVAVVDALWQAISVVGTAYSAGEAFRWLKRRVARGRSVLRKRFPSWASRGAHTHTLEATLSWKAWTAEELAQRLGVPGPEAADLLGLYGFTEGDDGTWRRGTDEGSILLRELHRAAREAYVDTPPDQARLKMLLVQRFQASSELGSVRIDAADLPVESNQLDPVQAIDPGEVTLALLAHMAKRLDEIVELLRKDKAE